MRKIYILVLLLTAFGASSCNDWLDVRPETEQKEDDQFSTYNGFCSAVTGLYMLMGSQDIYGERLSMTNIESLANLWNMTDNASRYEDYYLMKHDYENVTYSQAAIKAIYAQLFNTIVQANVIIKHVDEQGDVILDPAVRATIQGEAYGIRAYCHLDVLRLFGQVPGGTEQVSLPYSETTNIDEMPAYYTFDEFVGKLKQDIEKAESLLKDNDPVFQYSFTALNSGSSSSVDDFMLYRQSRMNYWAVRALEARMYLYLGDKAKAHDVALEVINAKTASGKNVVELSSFQDYGQATHKVYSSPSECLFSLHFANLHDISVPLLYGKPEVEGETNAGVVSAQRNLVMSTTWKDDLFVGCDPNDVREDIWSDTKDSQNHEYPTISKYYVEEDSPGIIPLLRLSEMYLIAMEGATTLEEVNTLYSKYMVSKNVSRSDYFKSFDDLKIELPKEYRREFFAEGQMFYFYKRNKTQRLWSNESMLMDEGLYIIPNPDTDF